MTGTRATCVVPQVVIQMLPPPKPALVQKLSSPPNFYGMFKRTMKRDSNQVILAVLQRLLFAQTIIGLCNTAKAFPGTPTDCTQFLGTTGWQFTDQADFPILADQKGLFVAISAILSLLDHGAANNSLKRCHHADNNVDMLASKLGLLAHRVDTLSLSLCSQADPEPKPRTKRPKITPAFAPHKPGSDVVLALLAQVNTVLEAVQLAKNSDQVPHAELQKHRNAIDQAMQCQLYLLDIALQTFCAISDRCVRLDKALGLTKVDHAGSLLDALNVSFDMHSSTPFLLLVLSCILPVQQRGT
ncbi:hypothetical protein C0993_002274 [Termitomyces sp. T159_Od127]|nr:hypothetical protein C0993_002274 [Termitomyces sp. T159_Od127]